LREGIEQQFEKAMETVSKFFREEKDFLYRKGEVKGIEKGREEGREEKEIVVVTKLITELGFSDEQAANFAEVPVSFVKSVRDRLKK